VTHATEQKVILEGVSWETYERLLAENLEKPGTRFAYDRGTLEIMVVSFNHEELCATIATLVNLIAAELEIDCADSRSTTFLRKDLAQGFEPDGSFYFRDPGRIRGKKEIDLRKDPPPDLVIEVDITSHSLNKLPIFWGIGVTEVWRYTKGRLRILERSESSYVETPMSSLLPRVQSSSLNDFIESRKVLKHNIWMREVREWAKNLTGRSDER
jgi:Uma2 family endonuclease